MQFDAVHDRLLTTPADPHVRSRMERLATLGLLGGRPDPKFDEFAARLAQITGAPFTMVNFISDREQHFSGLYTPSTVRTGALESAQNSEYAEPGRRMALDHGYCPHVIERRKALALDDVCDYPRFAGNPIVDTIGIRSYLGAPLIDRTGTTLGTVCAIATEPRSWGRPGIEIIKSMARELMELIGQREHRSAGHRM